MNGRWPINGRIPVESELAEEFGVGRSTVREAVRSLAHLGMLEPAPGRGTFVRSMNPVDAVLTDFALRHDWSDLLAVRRALETQAAELAARSHDKELLLELRKAHELDLGALDGAGRGQVPGLFHARLVALSGNQLLIDLYAALHAAVGQGVARGAIWSGQGTTERQADHAALLSAIEAGNPAAAAAVAAAHADMDLRTADPA